MTGEIREKRHVGGDGEWVVAPHFYIDGVEVTAEAFREAFPLGDLHGISFGSAISGVKPWTSSALSVHPSQIPAVMARNKKHGLSIAYTSEGDPICTDSGQRRRLMKIEGVRQKNSAYGY